MAVQLEESHGVRLAVEGCGHGTLHAIYASIEEACKQKNWPGIDLLIIGGDFQSVRNAFDLNCVSMPPKYREMCDFHEYYSGQRTAPYLTVFVGGNHEASNYLFELYHGGWVAPNIYYMGAANILRLGPLRIAGMSGIWKGFDYRKPHFERLPYNESDMKSIYHVRELDVRKLLQVRTQIDIGISHDWPQGIEWKGNWKKLFRMKKHFEDDANSGKLGSVAARQVLELLRPRYWFSAHLHCKFAAPIEHPPDITNTQTSFLALDKCLPSRDFLQLITASEEPIRDQDRPLKLQYDREWLAITRAFALSEPVPVGNPDVRVPLAKTQSDYRKLIEAERKWVDQNIDDAHLMIPENFIVTAPIFDGGNFRDAQYQQVKEYPNPQAIEFCQLLHIPNPFDITEEELSNRLAAGPRPDDFQGGRGGGRGGFRSDRGGRGRGHGRGRGQGRGRGRGGGRRY
ncbi:uncharacterized protein SEPMUDRAFT_72605 [Sphaerulina musiva SO2202]|uniref:Lariat debranching enzyme C-terminal domain-containing protein n=1 Tax=Sphaerulina musiva (strain SO2202) TaxID=692275 RepID=N1QGJ8_SPHMS|nr:uncharacterized protein SEPMUDRAFT_72605 [Sphaerulina musiva SO2202]EMF09678.1 hypothetical protein SEPMUDRAFT_72605 [Sphaerulina musiva SO2202]